MAIPNVHHASLNEDRRKKSLEQQIIPATRPTWPLESDISNDATYEAIYGLQTPSQARYMIPLGDK